MVWALPIKMVWALPCKMAWALPSKMVWALPSKQFEASTSARAEIGHLDRLARCGLATRTSRRARSRSAGAFSHAFLCCQAIAPAFVALAAAHPEAVYAKVDVDTCPDTAALCRVKAMPTFVVLAGGKEVAKVSARAVPSSFSLPTCCPCTLRAPSLPKDVHPHTQEPSNRGPPLR
jgi:hypothetical protein